MQCNPNQKPNTVFTEIKKKINPKIYIESQETTDIQRNFEQEEQS